VLLSQFLDTNSVFQPKGVHSPTHKHVCTRTTLKPRHNSSKFQHTLPFLQSESFQTHVGTIHRRAIGPLAHHNGTSAYSPSLTCHLPAPTIECLHRPRYKLTCSSRNFPIRTSSSNQKESVAKHTHVCTRAISKTHSSCQ
jgi:hypothetical protein